MTPLEYTKEHELAEYIREHLPDTGKRIKDCLESCNATAAEAREIRRLWLENGGKF